MTSSGPNPDDPRSATTGEEPTADPTDGRTGHPVVDGVLDTIAAGADRPLAQRAEELAAAHERLHGVLDEHRRTGAVGS